ncbi:hypothetical protein NUW54_g12954 [Trametes sanguinea]|uniref:Uncharacterized protein n=1 Tax=Trametes sanguinea TaxID=158606 RepID=A0ACC1MRN5_9APHY|nr:hypothetical protein NUW54_g12954 [Trametes sanguinea]
MLYMSSLQRFHKTASASGGKRKAIPPGRRLTLERGVRLRAVQRKLERRVLRQQPRLPRRARSSIVPDMEHIRLLRERQIRVRRLVRPQIPRHTRRIARNDTVGRAHGYVFPLPHTAETVRCVGVESTSVKFHAKVMVFEGAIL